MQVRVLESGDEPALEAFLLPRLAASMFLLSNVRAVGLTYTGQRLSGVYVAGFEREAGGGLQMAGVVAHCWNDNVLVQAPVAASELVSAAVAASGRPVGGLIGPHDQVTRAMAELGIDAGPLQLDEREPLYQLTLDKLRVPEPLRTGVVTGRRAELRDLDTLAAWRAGYEIEALAAEDTPELRERGRDAMARAIDEGTFWVLEEPGRAGSRLVAMSGFNARTAEAVQIGGVWTPPELRGRGYARCAVAMSLQHVREEGVAHAILFTGEDNVPAQRAYGALGFEHVGDFRLVVV